MDTRKERVIVTGASSGIGLDVARRFLAEGARLVLNARDERKLSEVAESLGAGNRVVVVPGEIGRAETGKRLAEAAKRAYGGADILINNAGVFAIKPFLETSEADLDALIETNAKGTFLVTQAVVPLLIEAGSGAIVNVGAVLVDQPNRSTPATAAMISKGGVHGFTRSLAVELAHHKIRVNAVAPSIIRTPLIGPDADSLASIHPLNRVGEVTDTSDAVLYLARATFVTGTILAVDGGYAHGR